MTTTTAWLCECPASGRSVVTTLRAEVSIHRKLGKTITPLVPEYDLGALRQRVAELEDAIRDVLDDNPDAVFAASVTLDRGDEQ